MKLLCLLVAFSFSCLGQSVDFREIERESEELFSLVRSCAKVEWNIELPAMRNFASGPVETLKGESFVNAILTTEGGPIQVLYQKLPTKEIIILSASMASEINPWAISGPTYAGPRGCDHYQP